MSGLPGFSFAPVKDNLRKRIEEFDAFRKEQGREPGRQSTASKEEQRLGDWARRPLQGATWTLGALEGSDAAR